MRVCVVMLFHRFPLISDVLYFLLKINASCFLSLALSFEAFQAATALAIQFSSVTMATMASRKAAVLVMMALSRP